MLDLLVVTPSAVLAVDGFVGASGNSHHVKMDVGVLRIVDCTCAQPCRPVVTCQWMAQPLFSTTHADMYQGNLLSAVERHFGKMSWYVDALRTAMCAKFHGRAQSRVRFISWRGRQIAHETLSRIRAVQLAHNAARSSLFGIAMM